MRRVISIVSTLALFIAASLAVFAQQAPDRSHPPAIGPVPAVHVPAVEKRTLSNGLPVWVVGMHKVPTVQIELAVRAGSGTDPEGKFGLASLTADMLDEGAGDRTALQIADVIDFLGADLTTTAAVDAAFADLHVPIARLADALPVLADVVARPTFPDAELKRVREERLTSLIQARDDPEQLVRFAFPRIVYGPHHRYGTAQIGTAASLQGFTVADVKAFHAERYRPSNATLVVAGDTDANTIVPMLERTLGQWKGGATTTPAAVPNAPQLTSRHVYIVDKPGAAQSQIQIGWVGVARSTPDYFALRVLNTILGETFTSRLNANLREEHGYTYGAASTFDMRQAAGPFYAAAGVQTDKTSDALKEFFNELTRIHQPIGPEELAKAKSFLALQLPRVFETTRRVAGAFSQIFVYNLPPDYYDTYGQHVAAITTGDVKRVADKYIQPDKFAVVIVGDRKVIEAGVRALNLGPVSVVSAEDVMK
jgi:predicted Zn-dependent peptidase